MLQRKFVLTSTLLFISTFCWSQRYYVGIKSGYNNASLISEATDNSIETQNLHAWHIGLVYAYKFQQLPIGISTEVNYTLKGTETNTDSLNYRFDYMGFPILLDFYPTKRLKISAGPEFCYLAKANNIKNDTLTVSILDIYKNRWELSGSVALSYSISFFADLGIKYNRSFTNVANVDALLDRRNLQNQYIQLFLLLKIAN